MRKKGDSMSKNAEPQSGMTLKRAFGMREAVTITVGTVIGVGLFTTGAQIVGTMGSMVVVATCTRPCCTERWVRLCPMPEEPTNMPSWGWERRLELWRDGISSHRLSR